MVILFVRFFQCLQLLMENFKLQGNTLYSNQRMCNCLKPSRKVASNLLLFFLHVTKCVDLRTQLTFKCCVLYHWSPVCFCMDCLLISVFLEVASAFDWHRRASVILCAEVLCSVSLLVFLHSLSIMVILTGLTWHLRKTNWIGEPTDALDNEVNTTVSFYKKI